MARRVVVDASVAVKWFLPAEDGGPQALDLLNLHVAGALELTVPSLFFYEVANALLVAVRRGRLSKEDYTRALGGLFNLGLTVVPLEKFWRQAAAMAVTYDRSVYDAAYLGLAAAEGLSLVTADRKLFNAVKDCLPWVKWVTDYYSP